MQTILGLRTIIRCFYILPSGAKLMISKLVTYPAEYVVVAFYLASGRSVYASLFGLCAGNSIVRSYSLAHKFGIRAVTLCFFILPSDAKIIRKCAKMSASILNNDSRVRRTTFYTQRCPQAMVRHAISHCLCIHFERIGFIHSVSLDELDDSMLGTSVCPTKARSLDVPVL